MKTLIVGTGVIGVIYGWALAEVGVDVTHLVRSGRASAYADGVTLDVLDERKGHPKSGTYPYRLKCVEAIAPTDGYELIIVPTGAHQLKDALRMLVPCAGNALFLTFTGLWDGIEWIDRLLPRDRYLLGYADGGGTIRNGVYWSNLGAEVHLGSVDSRAANKLEQVSALFARADMQPDIQPNMAYWLWQHIAGTVGFSAGFAKNRDLDSFLGDGALLGEGVLATRELYTLCERRGVDMSAFPETSFRSWPVWLVKAFLRWNFRHNASMQRYTAHAASDASLREAAMYHEAVMATARQLGVPMPHTEALGVYLRQIG